MARGSSRTSRRSAPRRGRRRASPAGGSPAVARRRARTSRSAAPDPARKKSSAGIDDPAAVEHEAVELARAGGGSSASAKRKPFLPSCSSRCARNTPVRSPTVFALQEIELHEALDRRFAGPVGVVHDLGDLALIVEGQPLLGAAGEQVEVAAHRPEEALGAVEAARTRRRVSRPASTSSAGRSTP